MHILSLILIIDQTHHLVLLSKYLYLTVYIHSHTVHPSCHCIGILLTSCQCEAVSLVFYMIFSQDAGVLVWMKNMKDENEIKT